jgi:S1-C subfamily serine protease
MRRVATLALAITVAGGVLASPIGSTSAQTVRQVFEKVTPSVVVVRARGREVTASGQTRFTETGSGVLVSADGR